MQYSALLKQKLLISPPDVVTILDFRVDTIFVKVLIFDTIFDTSNLGSLGVGFAGQRSRGSPAKVSSFVVGCWW